MPTAPLPVLLNWNSSSRTLLVVSVIVRSVPPVPVQRNSDESRLRPRSVRLRSIESAVPTAYAPVCSSITCPALTECTVAWMAPLSSVVPSWTAPHHSGWSTGTTRLLSKTTEPAPEKIRLRGATKSP